MGPDRSQNSPDLRRLLEEVLPDKKNLRDAIEMVRADVEVRGLELEVSLDARHHCTSADPVRLLPFV